MEIWHKISFNATVKPDFLEAIQGFGVIKKRLELPGGGGMMVYVDIKESNHHWATVSELVATRGATDIIETFFTMKKYETQNGHVLCQPSNRVILSQNPIGHSSNLATSLFVQNVLSTNKSIRCG
jgi:hypothetical protein